MLGLIAGLLGLIAVLLALLLLAVWTGNGVRENLIRGMHSAIWSGLHGEYSPYLPDVDQKLERLVEEQRSISADVASLRRALAPARWERES